MVFPVGRITVTGSFKTYKEPGGITGVPHHRRFCPNCGAVKPHRDAKRVLVVKGCWPTRHVVAQVFGTNRSSA
jgi:hypothetical protein